MLLFVLTFLHDFFLILEIVFVICMVLMGTFLFLDTSVSVYRENKAEKREKAALQKERVRELLRKEEIRRRKETEAHEGFFEESYVRGFDANGSLYHLPRFIPTEKALEYYRQMELLENTQQFNVVEELQQDLSNPKDL